jgi:hypothetical protein
MLAGAAARWLEFHWSLTGRRAALLGSHHWAGGVWAGLAASGSQAAGGGGENSGKAVASCWKWEVGVRISGRATISQRHSSSQPQRQRQRQTDRRTDRRALLVLWPSAMAVERAESGT